MGVMKYDKHYMELLRKKSEELKEKCEDMYALMNTLADECCNGKREEAAAVIEDMFAGQRAGEKKLREGKPHDGRIVKKGENMPEETSVDEFEGFCLAAAGYILAKNGEIAMEPDAFSAGVTVALLNEAQTLGEAIARKEISEEEAATRCAKIVEGVLLIGVTGFSVFMIVAVAVLLAEGAPIVSALLVLLLVSMGYLAWNERDEIAEELKIGNIATIEDEVKACIERHQKEIYDEKAEGFDEIRKESSVNSSRQQEKTKESSVNSSRQQEKTDDEENAEKVKA